MFGDARAWLSLFGALFVACAAETQAPDLGERGADLGESADLGARDQGEPDQGAQDAGRRRDVGPADAGSPADAGADLGASDAGVAMFGRVTALGSCDPGEVPGARCEEARVHVDGLPDIDVQLRIVDPPGAQRGVIVFGSGTGGGSFYVRSAAQDAQALALMQALGAEGFTIIERAWRASSSGGWFSGSSGLGVAGHSGRYATLLRYIDATYRRGQAALCITGNSGGSVEVGYAIGRWALDDIVDLAVPTSGPIDDLRDACWGETARPVWLAACEQRWSALSMGPSSCDDPGRRACVTAQQARINATYAPGETPCGVRDQAMPTPEELARLEADGPHGAWPQMPVRVVLGGLDCSAVVPMGIAYAERLAAAGADATWTVLPEVPHNVAAVTAGTAHLLSLFSGECAR